MGSADFLEALGATVTLEGSQVAQAIEACNFGFLFAPTFHPAMKRVASVRKQLGVRTVFNLLGPLTNPARPSFMVVGVGAPEVKKKSGGGGGCVGLIRQMIYARTRMKEKGKKKKQESASGTNSVQRLVFIHLFIHS